MKRKALLDIERRNNKLNEVNEDMMSSGVDEPYEAAHHIHTNGVYIEKLMKS